MLVSANSIFVLAGVKLSFKNNGFGNFQFQQAWNVSNLEKRLSRNQIQYSLKLNVSMNKNIYFYWAFYRWSVVTRLKVENILKWWDCNTILARSLLQKNWVCDLNYKNTEHLRNIYLFDPLDFIFCFFISLRMQWSNFTTAVKLLN